MARVSRTVVRGWGVSLGVDGGLGLDGWGIGKVV